MNCPDNETFELAIKLHNKLRYLTGGNEDDQDLVALLDCLIQDQRIILNSQTKWRNFSLLSLLQPVLPLWVILPLHRWLTKLTAATGKMVLQIVWFPVLFSLPQMVTLVSFRQGTILILEVTMVGDLVLPTKSVWGLQVQGTKLVCVLWLNDIGNSRSDFSHGDNSWSDNFLFPPNYPWVFYTQPSFFMTNPQLAQEQLQEDLLTLLEELDDDIKVVICKLVCETFDKLSPESISEEVR